jgi:hypothetical protein
MKFLIAIADPKVKKSKTDKDDPSRLYALNDMVAPSWTKSRRERDEPTRV